MSEHPFQDSTTPLYRGIADAIREDLKNDRWAVGSALPSFRSLAGRFEVGERSIRRAIDLLKSEGWLRVSSRQRLVVQKPSLSATTTGGLVLEIASFSLDSALKGLWGSQLQRGVEIGAGLLHAPLLVAHSSHLRNDLPLDLLEYPLKGLVLIGVFNQATFRHYEKLKIPAVLVDRPARTWKGHAVSVDNIATIMDATHRLLKLGHRRIAFMRYLNFTNKEIDPDAHERALGFVKAMRAGGIRNPKRFIYNVSESHLHQTPKRILEVQPPFTAVISSGPQGVRNLMNAAKVLGRAIPGDFSLVCLQGSLADFPSVSGPRINFEEMAREGVLLINKPRKPSIHLRIPARWMKGKTVAPPSP